ncbi:MAG: hypothetical protein L0I24_22735, partial [Pseudonocardia sp.]|nr:hypothetical protein [Pseudonocardia sp.]
MSSSRAERLVNLVLCLLSTRQFLSAERIRAIVPGYADAPGDDAFFRMFERDKAELRELGVPLETGRRSSFDTGDGYRIARQDYELGEIDLEPDEAAAVALAARLWDSPQLAGAARGALVKLRAAGVEVDEDSGRIQPRVRAGDPAFAPLLAAVQAGRAVTFRKTDARVVAFGFADLHGKTVITSAVTDEQLADLASRDVDLVLDSTPQPCDVTVDVASLEAMMRAAVRAPGGAPERL